MKPELLEMAWLALENAYAPYSKFRVGAAIETARGTFFSGCNVEVANYGCTLCAERTAIVKAVSEGQLRPGELRAVLVATETSKPTAPCGSCRQVIEEFASPETVIYMSHERGEVAATISHRELLPHAFGPGDLKETVDTKNRDLSPKKF